MQLGNGVTDYQADGLDVCLVPYYLMPSLLKKLRALLLILECLREICRIGERGNEEGINKQQATSYRASIDEQLFFL